MGHSRILVASLLCIAGLLSAQTEHVVTVFVHGTVGVFFQAPRLLFGLPDRYNLKLRTFQKNFRSHYLFEADQLAPVCQGLVLLSQEYIQNYGTCELPQEETVRAWYHLATAYHTAEEQVGSGSERNYALFGWSGTLDNDERRNEGYRLYDELIALRERYYACHGVTPVFNLVAHSHGGNVCLWLHDAEVQQKKNLEIRSLCLLGTPIQAETRAGIESSLFKTIISLYSEGDYIQSADRTGPSKKSYQRLSDVALCTGLRRFDVRIAINGDKKKVDHTSLFLAGRGMVFDKLCPQLPFVMFTPYVVASIATSGADQLGAESIDVNCRFGSALHVTARVCKQGKLVHSVHNDYPLHPTRTLYKIIEQKWHPVAAGRHPFFNMKSWKMFVDLNQKI